MIHYDRILQTGLQSLLAAACGWACGAWGVVAPEPTVAAINTLVLRFCIPCLQVWLLAIKTDMRAPGNWRALGVFLAWSASLTALLAAAQLVARRRLRLARLGVDALLLTTNNTGILGPVVLAAAVGPDAAPLGMLATVVLYFQQLPCAQLLFELERRRPGQAAAEAGRIGDSDGRGRYYRLVLGGSKAAAQQQQQHDCELQQQQQQWPGCHSSPDEEPVPPVELQLQQQHESSSSGSSSGDRHDSSGQPPLTAAAAVMSLLVKNPLVWSTGGSLALSCLGSSALLDPGSPGALAPLAFLELTLGWFAATTAPLTLFTTGLWMQDAARRRQQQQQQQWEAARPGGPSSEATMSAARLVVVLLLRATLAPATMVLLCRAAGLRGDDAAALVILALLPVAQTAFVVCKAHETGTHDVSVVMVASLLLMLPQLMAVLPLLEAAGIVAGTATAPG